MDGLSWIAINIVTSAAVSVIAAALVLWLSDSDKSRRSFLSGVLTEAYKREAKVYEDIWKAMFSLQQSSTQFLTNYELMTGDLPHSDVKPENLKADADELRSSGISLLKMMDQNRPFFHRDVYVALTSFITYTRSEQWMRLTYPVLYDMEGTLTGKQPKRFDFEESVTELKKRIDEVSTQIRARMTAPEESFISSWISPINPSWILRIKKSLQGAPPQPN